MFVNLIYFLMLYKSDNEMKYQVVGYSNGEPALIYILSQSIKEKDLRMFQQKEDIFGILGMIRSCR